MCMVRCGNRTGINIILFFFQHFTEIMIIICIREICPRFHRLPVINITKCHNIYIRAFGKFSKVTLTFATCTNAGNSQFITRRYKPTANHMAGNDKKACSSNGAISYKFSS